MILNVNPCLNNLISSNLIRQLVMKYCSLILWSLGSKDFLSVNFRFLLFWSQRLWKPKTAYLTLFFLLLSRDNEITLSSFSLENKIINRYNKKQTSFYLVITGKQTSFSWENKVPFFQNNEITRYLDKTNFVFSRKRDKTSS